MKQFILFLVMVLNTGMLYSQTGKESKSDILEGKQVGDTLTGKGVKYKLYRDSDNDLFVLQNLANQDSTGLREVYPDDKIDEYYIPLEVRVKLATIVGSCLPPEQRAIYKRDGRVCLYIFDWNREKSKSWHSGLINPSGEMSIPSLKITRNI